MSDLIRLSDAMNIIDLNIQDKECKQDFFETLTSKTLGKTESSFDQYDDIFTCVRKIVEDFGKNHCGYNVGADKYILNDMSISFGSNDEQLLLYVYGKNISEIKKCVGCAISAKEFQRIWEFAQSYDDKCYYFGFYINYIIKFLFDSLVDIERFDKTTHCSGNRVTVKMYKLEEVIHGDGFGLYSVVCDHRYNRIGKLKYQIIPYLNLSVCV